MDNKTIQKKKLLIIISKILISIVCLTACFIIWLYTLFMINFDGNWNWTIHNLGFFIIAILIIFIIFVKKKLKIVFIILVIPIILILCVNARYYKYYSIEIETKNHLHNKYGFKIEDMEIIKINEYIDFWLGEDQPREALITYKNNIITVYYSESSKSWVDNYEEIIVYEEPNEKIINNFKSIISPYEDSFEIITDPIYNNNSYSYIICLYTHYEYMIEELIEIFDNYISVSHEVPISYSLYITKNEDLFEELINVDVSTLEKDGLSEQTEINEILNEIGYNSTEITYTKGFDRDIFVNNGNPNDKEYQNIKDENIIFEYRGEELKVYNINKK